MSYRGITFQKAFMDVYSSTFGWTDSKWWDYWYDNGPDLMKYWEAAEWWAENCGDEIYRYLTSEVQPVLDFVNNEVEGAWTAVEDAIYDIIPDHESRILALENVVGTTSGIDIQKLRDDVDDILNWIQNSFTPWSTQVTNRIDTINHILESDIYPWQDWVEYYLDYLESYIINVESRITAESTSTLNQAKILIQQAKDELNSKILTVQTSLNNSITQLSSDYNQFKPWATGKIDNLEQALAMIVTDLTDLIFELDDEVWTFIDTTFKDRKLLKFDPYYLTVKEHFENIYPFEFILKSPEPDPTAPSELALLNLDNVIQRHISLMDDPKVTQWDDVRSFIDDSIERMENGLGPRDFVVNENLLPVGELYELNFMLTQMDNFVKKGIELKK